MVHKSSLAGAFHTHIGYRLTGTGLVTGGGTSVSMSLASVTGSPRSSTLIGCSEVWVAAGPLFVVTRVLKSLSWSVRRRHTKRALIFAS